MNVERESFYKAKKGSKLHLNYLIETNYHIIYKYIYRLTFNKELSEDIAQETCVRFIVNLKKFEYKAKVSTLMIAIGNNLLKDYYKKNNRIILKNNFKDEYDEQINYEAREILMSMDIETRKMFVLKYFHGYNYKEIGEILGIKEGTVKSRFHYAMKNIRGEKDK